MNASRTALNGMMRLMFYWLGSVLVLASWVGGALLLRKWHDKDFTTISKHAASTAQAHTLFAGILIAGGSLFYAWLLMYLAPNVSYRPLWVGLLTFATILQFITAAVPDKPGWQRSVHRYAAWTMALSWIPLVDILAASSSLSDIARNVSAFCGLYMFITLIVVAGFRKGTFLLYQALYVVAFQLAMLAAVYLG